MKLNPVWRCSLAIVLAFVFPLLHATAQQPKKAKIGPNDNDLQKLLKKRYNVAIDDLKIHIIGGFKPYALIASYQRYIKAAFELKSKVPQRIAVMTEYVRTLTIVTKHAEKRLKLGIGDKATIAYIRYYYFDAQIKLLRLKKRLKK